MRKQKIRKLNEWAYYVVDEGDFLRTIIPYEPLMANSALNLEQEYATEEQDETKVPQGGNFD